MDFLLKLKYEKNFKINGTPGFEPGPLDLVEYFSFPPICIDE